MPTSSTSKRTRAGATTQPHRRAYLSNATNENKSKRSETKLEPSKSSAITQNSSNHKLATLAAKYNKIAHISPPTSLTSTSAALRNSIMVGGGDTRPLKVKPSAISGHPSTARLADVGAVPCKQPASLSILSGSLADFAPPPPPPAQDDRNNRAGQQFAFLGGKSFLINSKSPQQASNNNKQQQQQHRSQSQSSLMSDQTTAPSSGNSNNSSTAQLQMLAGNGAAASRQQLHIGRRMDLKYVKSFIIILMAADLLITVFVHQFATNDELNLSLAWLRSIKLRLSLINLVLSSIWFIILIGGILFDVYCILFVSLIIDLASFLLLLGLSVVHFTRRIDYNTVQLTSLLALLFSVVVLHVYTLVMAALTLYLLLAVRRRQRSRTQQP